MTVTVKAVVWLMALACLLAASPPPAPASDQLPCINLVVNGSFAGTVGYQSQGDGIVVDAQALLSKVPGAKYYPILGGAGFAVQYGGAISFVALTKTIGFSSCKEVALDYQLQRADGVLLAPLNFLAQAVNSTMGYYPKLWEVRVNTNGQPSGIGHTIPQAQLLGQALAGDFTVRQGQLSQANAIDFFAAGYVPDCNGNNAGFPYLIIQAPPSPRADSYAQLPIVFQMDQDEALVLVGYTPPQVEYFSYRSYLVNRYYPDTGTRDKIYASLGDTINNYSMARSVGSREVYGRFYVIISTGNQDTYQRIRQAALDAGIAAEDIFLDIIPDDIFYFGLGGTGDGLNFLHRASLFNDADEKAAYLASPTVEILRVVPNQGMDEAPLYQQPLRPRGNGVSEADMDPRLAPTMDLLYQAILDKHAGGKTATRMDTSVWLVEGNQAIAERLNVLGETRDTLYTKTDSFRFLQNDLIVVFGVNHTKTVKSVYSNFSCYGAAHFNGFGGITNLDYLGSAREYLPGVDPELADMFYVWKFARQDMGDDTTFVVPQDVNHDYTGINYGAEAFMAFRSYIERPTMVGTVIDEIVRDQAVLIR